VGVLGSVSLTAKATGRLTIKFDLREWSVGVHLLPQEKPTQWGFEKGWYDGPLYSFGGGWLFLICWCWRKDEK
jgi:hypothetical protein